MKGSYTASFHRGSLEEGVLPYCAILLPEYQGERIPVSARPCESHEKRGHTTWNFKAPPLSIAAAFSAQMTLTAPMASLEYIPM